MMVKRGENKNNLQMENNTFKHIQKLKYFETILNRQNNMHWRDEY
jgi:hypothetical protein